MGHTQTVFSDGCEGRSILPKCHTKLRNQAGFSIEIFGQA